MALIQFYVNLSGTVAVSELFVWQTSTHCCWESYTLKSIDLFHRPRPRHTHTQSQSPLFTLAAGNFYRNFTFHVGLYTSGLILIFFLFFLSPPFLIVFVQTLDQKLCFIYCAYCSVFRLFVCPIIGLR